MTTSYGPIPRQTRHHVVHPARRALGDREVGLLAVCVVASAWIGASGRPSASAGVGALSALLALLLGWRHGPRIGVVVVLLVTTAGVRSAHEWDGARPSRLGPFTGWVTVVEDPVRVRGGTGVVLAVEGQRFQVYAFGSPGRRLSLLQAGDVVRVSGRRSASSGPHPRRSIVRHIVGRFDVDLVGDVAAGAPVARASNRVRGLLRRGAERVMTADDAALFTGLVIGDDTRQPDAMVDQFRAAGLSHLTAVSGQNVAFALAAGGVLLRRLPRWWRLLATLALIGWFAVLTRLEPSILRAATMASLAALSFAVGAQRSPARLLALAVVVLVLVDPFLVWSVAFWLSTGATAGVTVLAPALERRLRGPAWLVPAVAVTVGAQVGVVVPSWLVFRRMPALGLAANLLAVPVAGAVMLVGIPAGVLAALAPSPLARLVMSPATLGTHWVAIVARLAARLEPHGAASVAVWSAQAALLAMIWRRRGPHADGPAAAVPTEPPAPTMPGWPRT